MKDSSADNKPSRGVLPDIYSSIDKPDSKNVYEALKSKGFINSNLIPENKQVEEVAK